MDNATIDRKIAELVMGWKWHRMGRRYTLASDGAFHPTFMRDHGIEVVDAPPTDIDTDTVIDATGVKKYSTDPAADYEVLVKVRETWDRAQFMRFCAELADIAIGRSSWVSRGDDEVCGMYQPGDYAKAALRAVGVETGEKDANL